ncbi:MAG: hypothetical protein JSS32_10345 [Verrucomicrobia bacterium]|nr:hypothetical protein [Verrucomicrobiota bacterium]
MSSSAAVSSIRGKPEQISPRIDPDNLNQSKKKPTEVSWKRLAATIPLSLAGTALGVVTASGGGDAISRTSGVALTFASGYRLAQEVGKIKLLSCCSGKPRKWSLIPECVKNPFKPITNWLFNKEPVNNAEKLAWSGVGAAAGTAIAYSSDFLIRYVPAFAGHALNVTKNGLAYGGVKIAHYLANTRLLSYVFNSPDAMLEHYAGQYAGIPAADYNTEAGWQGLNLLQCALCGVMLAQLVNKHIGFLRSKEEVEEKPSNKKTLFLPHDFPDMTLARDYKLNGSQVAKIENLLNILHSDAITPFTMKCADGYERTFQNVTAAVLAQRFFKDMESDEGRDRVSANIVSFCKLTAAQAVERAKELLAAKVPSDSKWYDNYIRRDENDNFEQFGINRGERWLFRALSAKLAQHPGAMESLQATGNALLEVKLTLDDDTFSKTADFLYFFRDPKASVQDTRTSLRRAKTALSAVNAFSRNNGQQLAAPALPSFEFFNSQGSGWQPGMPGSAPAASSSTAPAASSSSAANSSTTSSSSSSNATSKKKSLAASVKAAAASMAAQQQASGSTPSTPSTMVATPTPFTQASHTSSHTSPTAAKTLILALPPSTASSSSMAPPALTRAASVVSTPTGSASGSSAFAAPFNFVPPNSGSPKFSAGVHSRPVVKARRSQGATAGSTGQPVTQMAGSTSSSAPFQLDLSAAVTSSSANSESSASTTSV